MVDEPEFYTMLLVPITLGVWMTWNNTWIGEIRNKFDVYVRYIIRPMFCCLCFIVVCIN